MDIAGHFISMTITSLHEKHMLLLDAVNYAIDERTHHIMRAKLHGWRDGLLDAGRKLDLCAADLEYMDERGVDRPMCAGLFLDWEPNIEHLAGIES